MSDIPIIIICFNNYKYVDNTLKQISNINKEYYKNIQIVNNNSTCINTIEYLKTVNVKVINNENNGPWISSTQNEHIYNTLPNKFILTDPDLEFNHNIPTNFIEIMSELSDEYKCAKLGFALDISDFDKMYQSNEYYEGHTNIYDIENTYWSHKISDSNYELYKAPIDTTFCMLNKHYIDNENVIRLAGNFIAKHLPWYIDNKLFNVYENYLINLNFKKQISTISKIIINHTEENYLKINKINEIFLIEKKENNPNFGFWKNIFHDWENDTFDIFDKYLKRDKIMIDIGGWIGTTAMYGSRKSKYVYSVEADIQSINDMSINMKINCQNNYTLINKAIYHIDNMQIKFGKNKFLLNSKTNDSTSQIYDENETSDDMYSIETITLESMIKNYQINPFEIGLIKVDIEGGEENILNDLFNIHLKYKSPLYVSFHYTWWKNKDLDRFSFLTSVQKEKIRNDPFTSILFDYHEQM